MHLRFLIQFISCKSDQDAAKERYLGEWQADLGNSSDDKVLKLMPEELLYNFADHSKANKSNFEYHCHD